MLVKEVVLKYDARLPFPWTLAKIRKAGFDVKSLLVQFGADLKVCTDANNDLAKQAIKMINQIQI